MGTMAHYILATFLKCQKDHFSHKTSSKLKIMRKNAQITGGGIKPLIKDHFYNSLYLRPPIYDNLKNQ